MRVVIHAGMHKTGSSSIQDHFSQNETDDIVYARWPGGNHCGLFILLFEDPVLLGSYHGFKARGQDFINGLPQMKARWTESIHEDMARSAGKTFVLSAEDISWPGFRPAVERMRDFFRNWTDDIQVVGYARSPLSFAVSAFQQMLKDGGLKSLNLDALWPHYKKRFLMLDEIFGREHVMLRHYHRSSLVGRDVVADFGKILGMDIRKSSGNDANASLSAEATALLYLQRRLGDGYLAGFSGAQMGNNRFIDRLRVIGSGKFTFSETAWRPVVEKNIADLRWIEERLGHAMEDDPRAGAVEISNEHDLIALALESYDSLEEVLIESIRGSDRVPVNKTVRALDLLRKFSY